jgi:hypothetical protein
MGDLAADEATLREADEFATRWLADPKSVDTEIAGVALDLGSRRATEARIGALLGAMRSSKVREDRIAALHALAGFDDPALLARALDATLADEIHADEIATVMRAAFRRRHARPIAEGWVRSHWDALTKKLPGRLGNSLVRAAGVGCSEADAAERAAFYGPRTAKMDGAARPLAGALEEISLCAALHDKGAPSFQKALLGGPKKK